MPSLTEVLAPWHDFYTLLGAASATMVGLLFVAATVASGVFSTSRRGPLRIFLSASVLQFVGVLVVCLLALAPLRQWAVFGGLVIAGGGVGVVYSCLCWRDVVRDGIVSRIDWEDRTWYAALPPLCYLGEAGAGIALLLHAPVGCDVLAGAAGVAMIVAIHNAWDITVWTVMRPRRD